MEMPLYFDVGYKLFLIGLFMFYVFETILENTRFRWIVLAKLFAVLTCLKGLSLIILGTIFGYA